MSFSVMLSQLAKGMTVTTEIFFVTLIFSLPLWPSGLFGVKCPNKDNQMDRFCIYLHYARNTSYAAADGSIFRTIFYFWNPNFHGLQPESLYLLLLQLIMPLILQKSTVVELNPCQ